MSLQVTSLEELKNIAEGEIVELPGFKEDIPFIARVKRVSLLNLISSNVIPNSLLSAAEELFYGKQSSKGDVDMGQLTKVMFSVAEGTLIEPSMETLKELNLQLTDEQIVALFNYSQQGVKALESFRKKPKDNVNNTNGETVQDKA